MTIRLTYYLFYRSAGRTRVLVWWQYQDPVNINLNILLLSVPRDPESNPF